MAGFLGFLFLLVASVVFFKKAAGSVGFSGSTVAPEGAIVLYKGVGGFIEVVGESHCQPALRRARSNALNIDGRLMFWATIEPENDNPHDANAVAIKFENQKLGHLTKGDAKTFRAAYAEAISQNKPIVTRACLTGGTKGKPTIGLMLDCFIHTQKTYKSTGVTL